MNGLKEGSTAGGELDEGAAEEEERREGVLATGRRPLGWKGGVVGLRVMGSGFTMVVGEKMGRGEEAIAGCEVESFGESIVFSDFGIVCCRDEEDIDDDEDDDDDGMFCVWVCIWFDVCASALRDDEIFCCEEFIASPLAPDERE